MKKILALILSLSLVLGLVAISAFATDDALGGGDLLSLGSDLETTGDETTADETTADETTADETTADETTVDETTADETTVDETTADETTTSEDEVIGDVNGDGVLDILDVVLTRAYIVGNETPDYDFDTLADVNGDGVVDIIDVVIMRAAIVNGTPIEPVTPADETTAEETTAAEDTEAETTAEETTGDETTGDETTADETTGAEVESDVDSEEEGVLYDGDAIEVPGEWEGAQITTLDGFEPEVGGTLVVTFVRGENAQFKFAANNPIWKEILSGYFNEWNCIDATADEMTFELSATDVAAFDGESEFWITGKNIAVTKVVYVAPVV